MLMISSIFVGLLDRQVGGLLALEDAAGVDADQTVRIRKTAAVAHQAAGRGKLAILVDRGHRVAERQCGELFAPAVKNGSVPITSRLPAAGPRLRKPYRMSRSVLACRTWSCSPEGAGRRLQLFR